MCHLPSLSPTRRSVVFLLAVAFCSTIASAHVDTSSSNSQPHISKSDYVRQQVFLVPELSPNHQEDSLDIPDEQAENFVDWYDTGVRSYLANDWANCIEYLERAVAGYRDFYAATASCRIKCARIASDAKPLSDGDVEHLNFYETIVRRTLCQSKCKQILLPAYDEFFAMSVWSQDMFRMHKPYAYLQLCYFRKGNVKKAAQATFTALLRQPEDDMMLKNLRWYREQLDVQEPLVDLEEWRFAENYEAAMEAYGEEKYGEVVEKMEASLAMWQFEYDECRAWCEGDFEQGWQPDFVTATANHFTYVLRCKQNCTEDLSHIRGKEYEHIFASHYEYLHISYYQLNKTHKACQAAASFLTILPDHEEMRTNLAFYTKGKLASCLPRPESKRFAAQQRYETRLLDFVAREFEEDRMQIPARKLQIIRSDTAAIDQILGQS